MKKILLLILLVLCPTLSWAANILVMGDSISAAHGLKQEQGWVALLQQQLRSDGWDYTVINASVSGETSAGGQARLERALTRHRPDIVILELGANDGLRGYPLKQTRQRLAAMIATIKTAGANVLLLGMRIPPNYGKRYTEMFTAMFPTLANEHEVGFVPFLLDKIGDNPELMQHDRLHPNATAQPLMAERVWEKLRPLIASAEHLK